MKIWSERDGRADVIVTGFSALENAMAVAAAIVVLAASIWVIGGLSW